MNRKLKEQIIPELNGKFRKVKVAILTDYCGLNVEEINRLRRELRSEAIEYRVVKNSIVKLAAKSTELELLDDYFSGPTAIAISYDDPLSPAKVLIKFSKDYPKLEIKSGVLDGKVITADDIKLLAEIPGREALLAQMLSLFASSQTSLVQVLNGILSKFICVLEAIKEKIK
ncbi:MAG: 50S ribosomal protein L10 [Deltaproteobacteria bacterium CG2_30_43_15]|nr:MAG: 50S ribosomal protein L10 [Deltaproteobacteria bacterium CG2_30_43_15]